VPDGVGGWPGEDRRRHQPVLPEIGISLPVFSTSSVESSVLVPSDPVGHGDFEVGDVAPGAAVAEKLGL
jgi:hypothetical protein